jgi:hypothetical protein
MSRIRYPLPPVGSVYAFGMLRAAEIRRFYAARCSPAEIATYLGISVEEVRRTVLRPVRAHDGALVQGARR